MSFPSVVAVNGGNATVDATSVTINLPDGSDVSGRLILLFFTSDGSGESFTWPTGFTEILAEGGTGFTNGVAYRFTDGTEGYSSTGATTTLTITSVEQSAHTTYLLSGVNTSSPPEAATATTGTSTAPDSGSLNPVGWGTEDTLWFAFASANGLSSTTPRFSAYPTNYTNGRSDISAGGNGVVQAVARRELNAASEDPGAFTIDTSAAWRASTIGVRPGAVSYTLAVTSASYTVTANAVGLTTARKLTVTSQSYTQTNNAVNLLYGRTLAVASQSYTVTGQSVGLSLARTLSVNSQSYSITGQDVGLILARSLSITSQNYTVTAQDVRLILARSLLVASQSYTVTGQDVSLIVARLLSVATQTYTVTGNNVGLTLSGTSPTLTVDTQTYTVTANNVGLIRSYTLPVTKAEYSVTGQDVGLLRGYSLPITTASYTVTAQAVSFLRAYLMAVASASYAVTFNDVILSFFGSFTGTRRVTAHSRSLTMSAIDRGTIEAFERGAVIKAKEKDAIVSSQRSTRIEAK